MSNISEQKALEAYPVCNCYNEQCMMQEDVNIELRTGYEEGYDKAMKDFLEKSCKWFESNLMDKEIVSIGIWHKFTDEDVKRFKNYMEEE